LGPPCILFGDWQARGRLSQGRIWQRSGRDLNLLDLPISSPKLKRRYRAAWFELCLFCRKCYCKLAKYNKHIWICRPIYMTDNVNQWNWWSNDVAMFDRENVLSRAYEQTYNFRRRPHGNKTLMEKTSTLNEQDFFIRAMYKHSY